MFRFLLACLMFAALTSAALAAVGGFNIPTVEDEKNTYRSWGWTWASSAEPANIREQRPNFTVSDPDIHGDTEGDDLWTSLMMYIRSGNSLYLTRANAWARYFKDDYRQCVGDAYSNFCYDRDGFGADHMYGWGLVALYEYNHDASALTAAESLAAVVEWGWGPNTFFSCLPGGCTWYGIRQISRHLLLVTRVAEATGNKARWIQLRDKILNTFMNSAEWDGARGMYFYGKYDTDQGLGSGAWDAGARIVSPFQIGCATEAFAHAYRITGRQDVKDRMIAMARFVEQYGLDSTYQYASSSIGIVNGKPFQSYNRGGTVSFWDPVYTTSLVNTLVWGYKLTGERHFYDSAKKFFNRGTKSIYGSPTQRECADNVCGHFVDTRFSSVSGYLYYDYNKGELQYTWAMFESPTAVERHADAVAPLLSAMPNPFSRRTRIAFHLPGNVHAGATLRLFDLAGRLLQEQGFAQPGPQSLEWPRKALPAGVYLLRLTEGGAAWEKKLVLLP